MKTKLFFVLPALFLITGAFSQTIDLTFTAIDSAAYVQLDSIKVMNRTQGGDTVLYYPDTVLTLVVTGTYEFSQKEPGFRLIQNYPNPFTDQSKISIQLPESGTVKISVTDILGRTVINLEQELEKGNHTYRFTPGDDAIYFLTARFKEESRSIKMMCTPVGSGNKASISYIGSTENKVDLKASANTEDFFFSYGDKLLYIGYYDTLQSGLLDMPESSETYIFQFATNIPCPGTPTVEYEGQVYHTIQIFSQCWLKENLNVGIMIPRTHLSSDNDTIEKYCYFDKPDSCEIYGGLYSWQEMRQYMDLEEDIQVQGICPPGWHLPMDDEWKILEGAVDSLYGIGDEEWDIAFYFRGYNAGANLKTTTRWYANGNGKDRFGFSALPGGARYWGNFYELGQSGNWYSSTPEAANTHGWYRRLEYNNIEIQKTGTYGENSLSVRCIKD